MDILLLFIVALVLKINDGVSAALYGQKGTEK